MEFKRKSMLDGRFWLEVRGAYRATRYLRGEAVWEGERHRAWSWELGAKGEGQGEVPDRKNTDSNSPRRFPKRYPQFVQGPVTRKA
jgi:hypothetical protein